MRSKASPSSLPSLATGSSLCRSSEVSPACPSCDGPLCPPEFSEAVRWLPAPSPPCCGSPGCCPPLIARPAGLRGRFVCHLLRLGRRLVVVLLPLSPIHVHHRKTLVPNRAAPTARAAPNRSTHPNRPRHLNRPVGRRLGLRCLCGSFVFSSLSARCWSESRERRRSGFSGLATGPSM